MGAFTYFSYSATKRTQSGEGSLVEVGQSLDFSASPHGKSAPVQEKLSTFSKLDQPKDVGSKVTSGIVKVSIRRFSVRSFITRKQPAQPKPVLSTAVEQDKGYKASPAAPVRVQQTHLSKDDKRARRSALAVRSLIIGPTAAEPRLTTALAKPQLNQIKSQLLKPGSANKVIAHLRRLPALYEPSDTITLAFNPPIHAVCLEHSDHEEHLLHFAKLSQPDRPRALLNANVQMANVTSAPIDVLANMFNDMHVINLINSPDLGLGQPGDGNGILAGALPTAETVMEGMKQITPQLMALGYATGKAFTPDHSGIHPPTDRMSVLTYWWGLEIVLPPPSLQFLDNAQSITGAVINFLTALSLINNGVREILPFVRYIAQFIDFEFDAIRKKDEGRGVVCAATWIMPAAMVPRPWDFPDPPGETINPNNNTGSEEPAAGSAKEMISSTPIYSIVDTVATPRAKGPSVSKEVPAK